MKNEQDIEVILKREKGMTLSSREHESIRSVLLEHAEKSLSYERPTVSPWNAFFKACVPALAFVCVLGGAAYMSEDSLPGEPLYAVKVKMVEETVHLSKFDPQERAEYELSLMQSRFEELRSLAESDEDIDQDSLAEVAEQIDEHIATIKETIMDSDLSEISHEERVNMLVELNAYAKAQTEIIEEDAAFEGIAEDLDMSEEVSSASLAAAIEEFSAAAPEGFTEYLGDQIARVSEDLTASTTAEEVRDAAEAHLLIGNESLKKGNAVDALISIIEAKQVIEVNEHLEGERR